ncbi:MAG: type 4a pilus biogenesis protein PilO, partial [bacterium]
RFPPRMELVSLARSLIELGKSKGLALIDIRPSLQELYALERSGVPVSSQNLMKLPIRIRFQGRFHPLGKFLEDLSQLPFQATVADFAIVQRDEIYPDVEAVFFMFLYVRW